MLRLINEHNPIYSRVLLQKFKQCSVELRLQLLLVLVKHNTVSFNVKKLMTAAAEAVKKWDGGRSPSGEVWEGLPSFGGLGVLPPGNFSKI